MDRLAKRAVRERTECPLLLFLSYSRLAVTTATRESAQP